MRLKLKVPVEQYDEEIEIDFWSFFYAHLYCAIALNLMFGLAVIIVYILGSII